MVIMINRIICFTLVFLMLFYSGCTAAPEEEIPSSEPTAASELEQVSNEEISPRTGGNLKLSMRLPKTLNPLLNADATVDNILKLIFEQLAVLDDLQKPQPNLAESFNLASDGMSVDIALRKDVDWSDGTPMTADDFTFSVSTLMKAGDDVIYKSCVKNIRGYSKIDDYTVRIEFNSPDSGWAYDLCFPVIPEHYYSRESDASSAKNMEPLGNGPYAFVSYTLVQELSLKSNRGYFRGKANIDNITVIITPDSETDLYTFSQGLVDVVSARIAEWGKYRGSSEPNMTEYATTQYEFIGFNFNNIILQDVRIRKALAYATPTEQIMEEIYLRHALKANTAVSPATWLYEPETSSYPTDVSRAGSLIKEAGYKEEGEGLYLELGGIKKQLELNILVNEENEERIKIADRLKKNLVDLKIACQVEALPFEEYEQRLREGKFDLFIGGFKMSAEQDLTFAFHGAYADRSIEGSNYFAYRSDEMNMLLEAATNAIGDEALIKAMSDLQKHMSDNLPCISLLFRNTALLTNKKIGGGFQPVVNNMFANIHEWFIIEEK